MDEQTPRQDLTTDSQQPETSECEAQTKYSPPLQPNGKCVGCGSALPEDRTFQCEGCDRAADDYWCARRDRDAREATDLRLRASGVPNSYRGGARGLDIVPDRFAAVLGLTQLLGTDEVRGLFLCGPSRSFKTTIAASVLAARIRAGADGRFVDVTDLMTDIQRSYRDDDFDSRGAIVDRLAQTPCLVLDDLGQEKATHHAGEVLRQILDRRWRNWMPGRWLIVTSNFTAEQLRDRFEESQTGNAILHRIAASTVYLPTDMVAA